MTAQVTRHWTLNSYDAAGKVHARWFRSRKERDRALLDAYRLLHRDSVARVVLRDPDGYEVWDTENRGREGGRVTTLPLTFKLALAASLVCVLYAVAFYTDLFGWWRGMRARREALRRGGFIGGRR